MPVHAQMLPEAFRRLPPLPQALVAALEVMRDYRSERADLVRVLSLDQGLTGLFLKMINSAYYGLPRRITSLDQAIGYLGFEMVEATIVAVSASRLLSRPVPAYLLEGGMLWQHAVAVASGAEWIARRRRIVPVSDAYVAGLLHDAGKLVMDLVMNHDAKWVDFLNTEEDIRSWVDIERELVGQDHAEVGGVLVRSWNLPDTVVEAVAMHHTPAQAEVSPHLTAAVHMADAAALMAGIGLGVGGLRASLDAGAVDVLEWTENDLESLLEHIEGAVIKARDLLSAAR